jgi:hypothetical protein
LSQRRNAQHPTGEREAFDRMMLMRSREFAHLQARELCDRIVAPDATGFTIH